MCGFVCVIRRNKGKVKIKKNSLFHRGPDYNKLLYTNGVNIRHWRLSIVDLTKKSNQPMLNSEFAFAYNGEIYDYEKISKSYKLNSKSDTIFLFKYLNKYKNLKNISNWSGFYSFLYFNKKKNNIIFSRDKIGKKPIYYFLNEDYFIISSEEKGILDVIKKFKIDYNSIIEYLIFKNIHFGKTYFKNIYLSAPGSIGNFDIQNWKLSFNKSWDSYYNKKLFLVNSNISKKLNKKKFLSLLNTSIEKRANCDVNFYLAMSSGMDSNLISYLISKNKNIKNFSSAIGFGIKNIKDENLLARKLANKNNIRFHGTYYNQKNFINDLISCVKAADAPLEHPSYIGYDFLCKNIKNEGKVLFTGEGSDDLFFGYDHYYKSAKNKSFAFRVFQNENNYKNLANNNKKIINNIIHKKIRMLIEKTKKSKFYSRDLEFKTHLQSLLKRNDRMSMKNSIEIRSPFLDNQILKNIGFKTNIKKKYFFRDILPWHTNYFKKKKIGFYVPFDEFVNKKYLKNKINPFIELAKKKLYDESNFAIPKKIKFDNKLKWSLLNIGIFIKFYEK